MSIAFPPVSPGLVYDPAPTAPPGSAPVRPLPALRDFYRDPLSWLVLAITSVALCYVGGLVMFWYHAVQLGEGGPQISWYAHWLLDSTFAFLALTPALALILPAATVTARAFARTPAMLPWLYAAVAGTLFALVTTPGPIAHDLVVGRGTWVAERLTALIGDPSAPLTPAQEYSPAVALAQQLAAGLPLYIVLMGLTVLGIRAVLR